MFEHSFALKDRERSIALADQAEQIVAADQAEQIALADQACEAPPGRKPAICVRNLYKIYRVGETKVRALDGVVLVISAREGVQPQTRILFHQMKKMKMPVILFINKTDRVRRPCCYPASRPSAL